MGTTLNEPSRFLEPTYRRAAVVWWAMMWRVLLIGVAIGFVSLPVSGFVLITIRDSTVLLLAVVGGLILAAPVGIYVTHCRNAQGLRGVCRAACSFAKSEGVAGTARGGPSPSSLKTPLRA